MVARDLYEAYALNDIPKEGYIVSGYFNCTDNHIIYKIFTYLGFKSINNKDGVITITADKVIIETYDAYSKKKIDKSTAETSGEFFPAKNVGKSFSMLFYPSDQARSAVDSFLEKELKYSLH